MAPKLAVPTDKLNVWGLPDTSGFAPQTAAARQQLRRVAFRMKTVDAVTTELVRIRNANHQRCLF